MTTLALILVVDALTAAFLLGLVHCKDITVAPPLPRRVPGAALVDNPPPDRSLTFVGRPVGDVTTVALPLIARSPTIGQRQRGEAAVQAYYQSWRWADAPTQEFQAVQW